MTKKNFTLLLDSGAWTAHTKGTVIDINKYAAFVHQYKDLFRGGAFNLDVIKPPSSAAFRTESAERSYENWIELRRLGVDTIPVHHIGDDDELYLKRYLDKTDYIALSATSKLATDLLVYGADHLFNTYLKNPDGSARVRIHGLGLSDPMLLFRQPWYSVDSSRSVMVAAHGSVLLPKMTESKVSYSTVTPISVSNQTRNLRSFFALAPRRQEIIREYCKGLGFSLDNSLEGRVLLPVKKFRKKQDPKWRGGLDIPEEYISERAVNGEDAMNLSSNWVARFMLNLYVDDQFIRYGRTLGKMVRMYTVISGDHVFRAFVNGACSMPTNRCLMSYARMTDGFAAKIRSVIDTGEWRG